MNRRAIEFARLILLRASSASGEPAPHRRSEAPRLSERARAWANELAVGADGLGFARPGSTQKERVQIGCSDSAINGAFRARSREGYSSAGDPWRGDPGRNLGDDVLALGLPRARVHPLPARRR